MHSSSLCPLIVSIMVGMVKANARLVFSKLNATTIDSNRGESLNIRIIQSPEPDAFMLPNGSMVISTGLLCTLDSEDELAAVIACELGHFVLDHQVNNIYRAERRAKRAAFWADVFATTASAALDVRSEEHTSELQSRE